MNNPQSVFMDHSGLSKYLPGQIADVRLDLIYMHEITGQPILRKLAESRCLLDGKEKSLLIFDHYSTAPSVETANMKKEVRELAIQLGIPYIEKKPNGISHALLPELGFVKPGMMIAGADSHTTTLGALGCFAAGFGSTDILSAINRGVIWMKFPEIFTIRLSGKMPENINAKDISLYILQHLPPDRLSYKCIHFFGEGLKHLILDERFTLCNMMAESGAKTAFIAPDEITYDYLGQQYSGNIDNIQDNDITADFEINLSDLVPLISKPSHPKNVCSVAELKGQKIDMVYIGGCTNGRLRDFEIAASILDGRTISENIRLIVTPATSQVFDIAMEKGYLNILARAGADIYPPGCGACFGGHGGVLASGEICLSTTNRNFPGRMGAHDAEIYLSSPQTAAVSAINGYITNPKGIKL